MDTTADWDEASGLIYNPEHRSWKEKPQDVMFAHGGFVPSAEAFSAKAYGKKVYQCMYNMPLDYYCRYDPTLA